uniref:Uncharacterized protein n=1 Tax=Anguilla anguilla TaxID=7936 RepID=A0A0E9RAH9_ANGAN
MGEHDKDNHLASTEMSVQESNILASFCL